MCMNLTAIFDGARGGLSRRFYDEKKPLQWTVINHADELQNLNKLPIEFQYSIAIHPSRFSALESLLRDGHGIAFGRQKQIPSNVLDAVGHIACTHHGALYPWLEDLVTKQVVPRWSESDFDEAADEGIDLKEQAHIINSHVANSVQIKLIQSPNTEATQESTALLKAMEKDIQKVHSLEVAHSLCSEHLGRTKDFKFLIILSIVLFAPVAHTLEVLLAGLGKFAAVILPGLYHESLAHKRSYSLGAASWQVVDKVKAKWPELLVMVFAGVLVQLLLNMGFPIFAGASFSVASCAVFTGTELRRLKKARLIHEVLSSQGKISLSSKTAWLKLFYGPIWWIHGLSIVLSVMGSMILFIVLGSYLSNGWVLAMVAILPMLIYEALLLAWRRSLGWRFSAKVKALLSNAIIT